MIDIDPRLDERLRSFYDQIEASPVPARVMEPAPVAPTRGRRTINVLAGASAISSGGASRIYSIVIWLIGLGAIIFLWQRSSTEYFKAPRYQA